MPQDFLNKLNYPGIYLLLLHSDRSRTIQVGKKGNFLLEHSYYLYIGSARGPGGIKSRLKHHLTFSHKPHWHIDYIKNRINLPEVAVSLSDELNECQLANIIDGSGLTIRPPIGIGSSDCNCYTHFWQLHDNSGHDGLKNIMDHLIAPRSEGISSDSFEYNTIHFD